MKRMGLVVFIAALFFAGLEIAGRALGLTPVLKDGAELWAYWRHRVSDSSLVLVGSSRIRNAIKLSDLDQTKPVQLGIANGSPTPVLEDLANDATFDGEVLVGVNPRFIFSSEPKYEQRAKDLVQTARSIRASWYHPLEIQLTRSLQSLFVMLSPAMNLRSLSKGLPRPRHTRFGFDREVRKDFARVSDEKLDREVERQVAGIGEGKIDFDLGRITRATEKIEARGGRVWFVRLPAHPLVVAAELEAYQTSLEQLKLWAGVRMLDVEGFDRDPQCCPDGVHMTAECAERFTVALRSALTTRTPPDS